MIENPRFNEALPKQEASTDRHAQVEQLLVDGVEAVTTEHGVHTWLNVISRLPDYSLNNTLLIAYQKPDATMVAGYTKWKEMGRQVRKGEKAIKIYVPFRTKE